MNSDHRETETDVIQERVYPIDQQEGDHRREVETPVQLEKQITLEDPPDGGWAWIIVLVGAMASSFVIGFNKNGALVYQQLLTRYRQSAAATATASSISGTMRMICSPVGSIVINHTSHRSVGILAGILCALGVILTGFMPSLPLVYLFYGFLSGFGTALLTVVNQSMVNLYFSKHRGKGNAVFRTSLALGNLIMTQLLGYLFNEYGFTGTLLIVGALMLHVIPASIVFRPMKERVEYVKVNIIKTDEEVDIENGSNDESLRSNQGQHINSVQKKYDIHQRSTRASGVKKLIVCQCLWRGLNIIAVQLGLQAFRNLSFCMCVMLMTSFSLLNSTNISLLAALALEKGYTMKQVTTGMTLNFAIEIVSRFFSGFLFDLPAVRKRRLLVFSIIAVGMGSVAISMPFTPVLIPSIVTWMLLNSLLGGFNAQSGTVMSDTVPRSLITSSVGLMRLVQGLGNLIGPVIGGILKDVTGSYRHGYFVAGIQMTSVGMICIILNLVRFKR